MRVNQTDSTCPACESVEKIPLWQVLLELASSLLFFEMSESDHQDSEQAAAFVNAQTRS